jgi:hypothetical protein
MSDHLEKLHNSLGSWAKITQSNTEQRIAKALFSAILKTSNITGAFSGWLLAISGATIGLAFSSVDSVLQVLTPGELRAAVGFLLTSCVTGFIARIAGSYVDLHLQLISDLEDAIVGILDEHGVTQEQIEQTAGNLVPPPNLEPDIQRAVGQVLECLPAFLRNRALLGYKKGEADPLFVYKRATRINLIQGIVVIVQAVTFGLFAVVLFVAL